MGIESCMESAGSKSSPWSWAEIYVSAVCSLCGFSILDVTEIHFLSPLYWGENMLSSLQSEQYDSKRNTDTFSSPLGSYVPVVTMMCKLSLISNYTNVKRENKRCWATHTIFKGLWSACSIYRKSIKWSFSHCFCICINYMLEFIEYPTRISVKAITSF